MNEEDITLFPTGYFCIYKGEPFCDDYFNIIYRDQQGVLKQYTPQVKFGDLATLSMLIYKFPRRGAKYIEIGAWVGHTTCVIAAFAKARGSTVKTIDNFKGNIGAVNHECIHLDIRGMLQKNLIKYGVDDVVEVIEGESRCVTENADFIFLDACHTYTEIKADLDHWWPLVNPGGILCGHDLDCSTWNEEFIELDYVENKHHGVIKAVVEKFGTKIKWFGGRAKGSSIWYVQKDGEKNGH